MTNIYLIRHAEAEGNLYRIAQGQYNSLITDRGHRQIAALEKRFAGVRIDGVYSSDLYRTCVTAGAIYIPRRLPLRRMPALREICVGDWEQKTWGEIARSDGEQMQNFTAHLDRWHVAGAETPEQVRDRVLAAVRQIARENQGKTVAVFSHGCAIRILLATLQGYSIAQVGGTPLGANTAVSLLQAEGEDLRVVFRDDVSHLTEELTRKRTGRQPRPLDPGLFFLPAELPRQGEWLRTVAAAAWADSGDSRAFDAGTLLREAETRPTVVGQLEGTPVGLLQLHPEKEAALGRGWLSLYCVDRDYRGQGYGVQLLGQAVQHYRALGRDTLCVALTAKNQTARRFFTDYGFRDSGETDDRGRQVLCKRIAFAELPDFS